MGIFCEQFPQKNRNAIPSFFGNRSQDKGFGKIPKNLGILHLKIEFLRA